MTARSFIERVVGPSGGMADTRDLKSLGEQSLCGFESRLGHSDSRQWFSIGNLCSCSGSSNAVTLIGSNSGPSQGRKLPGQRAVRRHNNRCCMGASWLTRATHNNRVRSVVLIHLFVQPPLFPSFNRFCLKADSLRNGVLKHRIYRSNGKSKIRWQHLRMLHRAARCWQRDVQRNTIGGEPRNARADWPAVSCSQVERPSRCSPNVSGSQREP